MKEKKDEFNKVIALAKSAEKESNFLKAAYLYKDALDIAVKEQNSKDIIFCKRKIIYANKNAEKDFKEIKVENSFDTKMLNDLINNTINRNSIGEILKYIAMSPNFYPKYDDVEKISKSSIPIFRQFASTTTISDKGLLIKGGQDGVFSWFMEMYDLRQQIIVKICLIPIFNRLSKEKDKDKVMTADSLMNYFQNSGLFESKELNIIRVGIERYFAGDYISSMHILVPMFESSFLSISQQLGLDIVALQTGKEKEISMRITTLSTKHLESDKFINKWGKDLCEQIKFVFFEPLGYRLRHKIAHGEISQDECNLSNTTLIIYFYLVITGRVQKVAC